MGPSLEPLPKRALRHVLPVQTPSNLIQPQQEGAQKVQDADLDLERLAQASAGILALLDPDEASWVTDRVLARIRADAATSEMTLQIRLARPVVNALMRVGDLARALEVAAELGKAGHQMYVQLDIAAALFRTGQMRAARLVVAEVLRLAEPASWSKVLREVGEFLPDVVAAAGAEVIELTARNPAGIG